MKSEIEIREQIALLERLATEPHESGTVFAFLTARDYLKWVLGK